MPRIQTTVVGSYPIPDWLVANPSEQALMDATRVVIGTQEQCRRGRGLRRRALPLRHQPPRDQRHDRVLRAADGRHHAALLVRRPDRLPLQQRHEVPHPAAGHGGRPHRPRQPRPAAGLRACQGAGHAHLQVHRHRPAHAGQDADRQALRRHARSWRMPSPTRWPQQVRHLDADVVQIDEANLPGHPEEWEWAAVGDQPRARRGAGHAGRAPVLRQLRRPDGAEGHLGQADELPERAARRPRRAGVRAPPGRRTGWPSGT